MATTNSLPNPRVPGGMSSKPGVSSKGSMGPKTLTKNSQHTQSGATLGGDGSDSEEDEASGDSSANEGHGSTAEADAQALSGVATLTMEPSARLAGKATGTGALSDDDESMADDTMASAEAAGSEEGDDEDYSGLAALSDDGQSLQDGGEDELLKAAETDLIHEFEQKEKARNRNAIDDSFWLANGFLDDDDDEIHEVHDTGSIEDGLFGAQTLPNLDEDPFGGAELFDAEWTGMVDYAENQFFLEGSLMMGAPTSRPKRVRFEEGARHSASPSDSSDDSSDDEPDSHFPDIFMDQDDPKIQQLLSFDFTDGDVGGNGSDAGSVYDFEDDGDKFAFEVDQDSESSEYDDDSESEDDSDDEIDYETEDESLEEQKAKMLEIRRANRVSASVSAPVTPTKATSSKRTTAPLARSHSETKATSPKSRKGPRMGTFALDPTKATVVSDETGKTTVLYMPSQPSEKHKAFWDRAKSAASSRDSSPRGSMSIVLPSHGTKDNAPQRPFTAQSTLATMFDGNMDFMRTNDITPQPQVPQTKYPPMMSSFTSVATTDDGSDEMDEDFTMLIDMDPESDTDAPSPGGMTSDDAPAKVAPTFFTHGTVGSFRLNQHRARQESSLASHPDSRASTSEHNALQSGRRGAGNAPITPARKKRVSKDMSRTGSGVRKPNTPAMSSPLASRRSRGQSLSGRLDQTLAPGFSMWQ